MNKDNAKDYLPLVQAMADGKVLQVYRDPGNGHRQWFDLDGTCFDRAADQYRIKPEPREKWFVQYKGGSESGPYADSGTAECFALHDHEYKIVCYREVIE